MIGRRTQLNWLCETGFSQPLWHPNTGGHGIWKQSAYHDPPFCPRRAALFDLTLMRLFIKSLQLTTCGNSLTMALAWAYSKGLYPLKHGHALWDPKPIGGDQPTSYDRISPGDVGFYNNAGGFTRLFNIFLEEGHASHTRLGVPNGFQPLRGVSPASFIVYPEVHDVKQPIRSSWVEVQKISAGAG